MALITRTPPVPALGSTSTRAHWMDAMRGLAVLLVVFTHTVTMPRGLGGVVDSAVFGTIVQLFQSWRMPMLVFLSGVLLPRSAAKPLGVYYRGKLERILWPFLVWMVLLALSLGSPALLASGEFWRGGAWHLWFLWVLMFCYLLGPLVRHVPAVLIALVLFLVLLEFVSGPRDWVRPLYWGVYFFLGAATARLLPRIRTAPAVLGVLAVVLMLVTVVAHRGGLITVAERHPWSVFAALPGILVVLWLAPRLPRLRFLEFCGRRSIVLYVAHMPVLILAVRAFRDLALTRPIDFYLAIATFTFVVPLLMALAYPWLRWLFESPTTGRTWTRPVRPARPVRSVRSVQSLRPEQPVAEAEAETEVEVEAEVEKAAAVAPAPAVTPARPRPRHAAD